MKSSGKRCLVCREPFRGGKPKSGICWRCRNGEKVAAVSDRTKREREATVARLRAKLDPGPLPIGRTAPPERERVEA